MSRKIWAWVTASLILFAASVAHAATFSAVADTFVESKPANANDNFGNLTIATVGRTMTGAAAGIERGLLHFDVSTLPLGPVSTTTLRLFIDGTTGPTPLNLGVTVFQLTTGFVEGDGMTGVTWNTQPPVFPAPTNSSTMNTLPGDWFEMDVTAVVRAVRAGADPNNVWLRVAPTDETTNDDQNFNFRTREFTPGGFAAQLVITPGAPAPLLSPAMLLAVLAWLFAVGALALRRAQSPTSATPNV